LAPWAKGAQDDGEEGGCFVTGIQWTRVSL